MGFFLLVGLALAILGIVLLAQPGGRRALGVPLLLIGLVVAVVSRSFVVVPAGHVGVVFNVFGGVQPGALGEGFHILLPGVQNVILYDARLKEVTLAQGKSGNASPGEDAITARSKEGLDIGVDVTVQYRIKREEAPLLHRNLGPNSGQPQSQKTTRHRPLSPCGGGLGWGVVSTANAFDLGFLP